MKYVRLCRIVLLAAVSYGVGICSASAATHQYRVEFSENLQRVAVTARLASTGLQLRARGSSARGLSNVRGCAGQAISVGRGKSIELPGQLDCITYDTSVEMAETNRRLQLDLPDAYLTSPSRWMWLPDLGEHDRIAVEVILPEGVVVSLPWPKAVGSKTADARFEFGPSPKSGYNLAVLGNVIELDMTHTGIMKPVAYVGPSAHSAKILRWLEASAIMLRDIAGKVPNDEVQILVLPVSRGRGRTPVPFGRVIRDQGESIQFFVDLQQSQSRFLGDWTAPHEFAHTLLPFVGSQWVSEGFAGYYQNVMLARAGIYSEQQVWQRLVNSFDRGADLKDAPSPNGTSDRPFWEVRMMLYWSAAALALMADAEIRLESNNERSLDTVLGSLAACCLPSATTWQAGELFAELDRHGGNGIGARMYRSHADEPGMPDTTDTLAKLGVVVDGSKVTLDDRAPWAHIRKAIMGQVAK